MITKQIPLKNMEISKEKNIKVTLKFLNFVYMYKFSKKKWKFEIVSGISALSLKFFYYLNIS